jgi:uncharacterized membrane protein YhaH (DUF805 family)
MDQASSAALSQDAVFSLSLYMLLLGALIVVLIILFAVLLLHARRWWGRKEPYPIEILVRELHHLLMDGPRRREAVVVGTLVGSAYAEHLARRNEFWVSYGQVTVAVLLLIVVTVLLLTRTIDPDAGLPILSGIAGFAIAKTTGPSGGVGVRPPDLEKEG